MRALRVAGMVATVGWGCGGGGGSGLCDTFAPCGGEVEGTWQIVELCSEEMPFPDSGLDRCDEATFEPHLDVTGTLEFTGSGNFTISTAVSGYTEIHVPEPCIPDIVNCSALSDENEDRSCSGTGQSGCTCRIGVDEADSKAGTWSVSGTELTLDYDEGDTEEDPFCRTGDRLVVETGFGVAVLALE